MDFEELKAWIANDPSDYAERIRAVLRPMAHDMIARAAAFNRLCEKSDHHPRKIMRRKIRRMIAARCKTIQQ